MDEGCPMEGVNTIDVTLLCQGWILKRVQSHQAMNISRSWENVSSSMQKNTSVSSTAEELGSVLFIQSGQQSPISWSNHTGVLTTQISGKDTFFFFFTYSLPLFPEQFMAKINQISKTEFCYLSHIANNSLDKEQVKVNT